MSERNNTSGMHRPRRGPLYWDWRCLTCGEAVDNHPSWWRRLIARVRSYGEERTDA